MKCPRLLLVLGLLAGEAVAAGVANGGFEEGLEGWSGGATMALDETVAHGGARSVRLAVEDPIRDEVYVRQNVPVTGGALYEASCFARTEDVREAPGKMPSVGAGLIVEWADADGKWLTSGEYACGLWGTTNWTRVSCEHLEAPEGAFFAIVHLALRGTGTAWFDDVSLARRSVATEKTAPADGAVISNNCPRFEWRQFEVTRRYTLELSCDNAFPAEATLSFDAGGFVEFQLESPLAPGTWHWRVSSAGWQDATSFSFTQTAPQDADCLPPLVRTRARRVTDGNEPVAVLVGDGGTEPPKVALRVNNLLLPACCHGAGKAAGGRQGQRPAWEFAFAPPPGGWPPGLTECEIVAEDSAGNSAATPFWLLNTPIPANPVTIGPDGCYWQGGERIFPLGIYEVAPKYMAEVRAAGWDVVHQYAWEYSQDDDACRDYLDACWAADGLRAFIGFDRGVTTHDGIVQGSFAPVARRVGALAGHPGLFCWYLFDEPNKPEYFVTPDRLAGFADLVRALDPFHPVVMTTWGMSMNDYRRTWDTHWTQAYETPADVAKEIDKHRRLLENASPITLLVNCNDNKLGAMLEKGGEIGPGKFWRDIDHLRAAAFLGIAKECNGLFWWWFARDNCGPFYSAACSPEAWADLVRVVSELRAVLPLVTADGPVAAGTAEAGKDRVEWWRKNVGGRALFIAVNTADHPVSVTIPIPGDAPRALDLRRYEVLKEGFDETPTARSDNFASHP